MRLGFLGTGEITAAMVRGLQGQGHAILVSPRNAATAARLAAEMPGVTVAPDNAAVVEGAEVVFLCLLAHVAEEVLPALPFRAGQSVISVMVDAPLARLRALCAPATDIARCIPLPPIARGAARCRSIPLRPRFSGSSATATRFCRSPRKRCSMPISAPRRCARRSLTRS